MSGVTRMIRWFQKDPGEEFVGEATLRDVDLGELQRLFSVPRDNPMYESYPVRQEHVSTLQAHVDVPIELDRYEYFVEADAD